MLRNEGEVREGERNPILEVHKDDARNASAPLTTHEKVLLQRALDAVSNQAARRKQEGLSAEGFSCGVSFCSF